MNILSVRKIITPVTNSVNIAAHTHISSKKLGFNNISNCKSKILNRIKSIYLTAKENAYLFKYKLKEYIYGGRTAFPAGIISKVDKPTKTRFCQKIKPYLKKIINNNVDPKELDRRLTTLSNGAVKEEIFIPKGNITIGRKKIYTMPTGKEIILETHNYIDPITKKESVVTRIYDNTIKKNRDYFDMSGNFIHGTTGYKNEKAHLVSGQKGIDWILAA